MIMTKTPQKTHRPHFGSLAPTFILNKKGMVIVVGFEKKNVGWL